MKICKIIVILGIIILIGSLFVSCDREIIEPTPYNETQEYIDSVERAYADSLRVIFVRDSLIRIAEENDAQIYAQYLEDLSVIRKDTLRDSEGYLKEIPPYPNHTYTYVMKVISTKVQHPYKKLAEQYPGLGVDQENFLVDGATLAKIVFEDNINYPPTSYREFAPGCYEVEINNTIDNIADSCIVFIFTIDRSVSTTYDWWDEKRYYSFHHLYDYGTIGYWNYQPNCLSRRSKKIFYHWWSESDPLTQSPDVW